MKTVTTSLSHPVIFVMDADNRGAVIPTVSETSLTSRTGSCVALRVIADVDGDVRIKLASGGDVAVSAEHVRAFEGTVETPSGKIAVVTAQNERILENDVPDKVTRVRISVDDTNFPTDVVVEVLKTGTA